MKPQFKPEEIYLDLSKLSEDQIKSLPQILENAGESIGFHTSIRLNSGKLKDDFVLYFNSSFNEWCLWNHIFKNNTKTELSYSQFLDMMGEKSAEKPKDISFDTWVNMFVGEKQANSEKERINSDGTLYIGEGLENYYIDQLERTGKFKVVSIYATSEEVLRVGNNLNADDLDFVTDALNFYFHDAHNNLERKVIGDIEKKNYQYQLEKAKELIKKLTT